MERAAGSRPLNVSVRREDKFCLEQIEVVQNHSLLVCAVQFLRGNRQVIAATAGEIQTIEKGVEEQRRQIKVLGLSLVGTRLDETCDWAETFG